jgi:hypothetical protein
MAHIADLCRGRPSGGADAPALIGDFPGRCETGPSPLRHARPRRRRMSVLAGQRGGARVDGTAEGLAETANANGP